MIPKIIHYCWFGKNPKPEKIKNCISSWQKFCPDWEIKEWNEFNYDINAHLYTKDAYEAKKWAFVSDVARLEILYEYGGFYLDTDVEILTYNPFLNLLEHDNILAFETERSIASGLCMGAHPGSLLCEELLKPYLNSRYSSKTEMVNSMVNKPIFEKVFPDLMWDGQTQNHNNTYIMGCSEYGKVMKHHGARSWCDNLPEYKISGFWKIKKMLRNPQIFLFLENRKILKKVVPIYEFIVYDFFDLGLTYYIKRLALKFKDKLRK